MNWRRLFRRTGSAINERRRTLIKLAAFGGATFILGKVLGPSLNLFGGNIAEGEITEFKNFRVVDNDEELGFYDKVGNEILIIEKES
ncbi:hypothetical protein A3F55_02105 [Candidatus Adlerbacteria bacterium RIFCSPHIGHO2_12_FULL_53_18]|uniref:Uncharacterized protein n=2 Tax=Parcubacteria group TaxID=1794811 RepID=A0A1F4XTK7_9BACT|nr:MAG: hypothetical protein A3F55_02105 [Candidatus Adlerbacteria bacterium RIFCSPHIGHO2_12_FULL_53_18]OGG51290.1 MAG: hypothetical protein A2704_01660 [Candidatus Kaiserbacteria bacterium RIFCSPHIGHO2_01_FULL_54_36b]